MIATPEFDFQLGEMADQIRDTTRRFAEEKIMPLADKVDREDWFPRDLWPQMGELGLHGITVDEEDGGLGLGYLEHAIAVEEISRASASIGLSYGAHSKFMHQPDPPLGLAGAEGQISARTDLGRACRFAGHVGSGRGQRCGRHEAEGRSSAGWLSAQRHQILDHQFDRGRHAGRLCQDAS